MSIETLPENQEDFKQMYYEARASWFTLLGILCLRSENMTTTITNEEAIKAQHMQITKSDGENGSIIVTGKFIGENGNVKDTQK